MNTINKYNRPEGDLLVAFSGGNCPGAYNILQSILETCRVVQDETGTNFKVFGTRGGLGYLVKGDTSFIAELNENSVQPPPVWEAPIISFGKYGPSGIPSACRDLVNLLLDNGINYLIVWGGNFSLWSSAGIEDAAIELAKTRPDKKRLRVGCLPKSIDNDLGLPPHEWTIGFATASRELSLNLRNLGRDCQLSGNMVQVRVLQGNQTGHLTERAARLCGCPFYLIPEHFDDEVDFNFVCDIVLGAILKGVISDPARFHFVAPVAEGVIGKLKADTCPGLVKARAEAEESVAANVFPFDDLIKERLEPELKKLTLDKGRTIKIRSSYLGYHARGATVDDIDNDLANLLTTTCVNNLFQDKSGFLVSGDGNLATTNNLSDLVRDESGGLIERKVNISDPIIRKHWLKGRRFRLLPSDLEGENLKTLSQITSLSEKDLLKRFSEVAKWGAK